MLPIVTDPSTTARILGVPALPVGYPGPKEVLPAMSVAILSLAVLGFGVAAVISDEIGRVFVGFIVAAVISLLASLRVVWRQFTKAVALVVNVRLRGWVERNGADPDDLDDVRR